MLISKTVQKTTFLIICLLLLAHQLTTAKIDTNKRQKKLLRRFSQLAYAFGQLVPIVNSCALSRTVFTCEKPIYRPNEEIVFRSHTFNLMTKEALMNCQKQKLSVSIFDVNMKFVASASLKKSKKGDNSAATFRYKIPEVMMGGVYFATLNSNTNSDRISFFVNTIKQPQVVALGDWNSEFAVSGLKLEGKITLKALSVSIAGTETFNAEYYFMNSKGDHLAQAAEAAVDGVLNLSFKIPADFEDDVFFTANIKAGAFSTTYSKTFSVIDPKQVKVDFTIGSAKLVKQQKIRFFFQAFADAKRTVPLSLPKCRLLKVQGNKTSVMIRKLYMDQFGRGSFQAKMYDNLFSGNAVLVLSVKWSKDNESTFEVPIHTQKSLSAVYMGLPKLVFKQNENIEVSLKSSYFNGDLRLVVQDKTKLLYIHKFKYNFQEKDKKMIIPVADLHCFQGGAVNVQLFVSEKSLQSLENNVSTPLSKPQLKPVGKSLKNNNSNSKTAKTGKIRSLNNEAQDEQEVEDEEGAVRPLTPKLANMFKGVLLQEALVFLLPAKTLVPEVTFNKKAYLPKESVSISLTINDPKTDIPVEKAQKYCAMIVVTNENSFSKVEPTNENPSLITKLFLEKEVMVRDGRFPNAGKYIDELFLKGQLSDKASKMVQNLLGNQRDRQLLFEPKKLQEYFNKKQTSKYSNLRDFFDYLIPIQRTGYSMNFGSVDSKKTTKQPQIGITQQSASFDARPTVSSEQINSMASSKPVGTLTDYLKMDTIFYQESVCFKMNALQKFTFQAPDLSTKYRVSVFAYSDVGFYGMSKSELVVEAPIDVFLAVPEYIYSGESFYQYLTIVNNLEIQQTILVKRPFVKSIKLAAKAIWKDRLLIDPKRLPITVEISCGNKKYTYLKTFNAKVHLPGVYQSIVASQCVVADRHDLNTLMLSFQFPKNYVENSVKLSVCYMEDMAGLILDAVKRFNRIPAGCFEQISSTFFPIVVALLILQKLPKTDQINALIADFLSKLRLLLPKMLSFHTKDGGFDWFGKDPGHTTLTAYFLFQFHMITQIQVDQPLLNPSLLDSMLNFLKNSRNDLKGFKIRTGYNAIGYTDQFTSDLYILSVLATFMPDFKEHFSVEMQAMHEKMTNYMYTSPRKDPYKLALYGLCLLKEGTPEKIELTIHYLLQNLNHQTGCISNAETSITKSSGQSLVIETTALTLLLLARYTRRRYNYEMFLAFRYLSSVLSNDHFMSTQATVLTLYAFHEYVKEYRPFQNSPNSLEAKINKQVKNTVNIPFGTPFSNSFCIDLSPEDSFDANEKKRLIEVIARPTVRNTNNKYLFKIIFEYNSEFPLSSEQSTIEATIDVQQTSNLRTYTGVVKNVKTETTGMVVWEFVKPSCYELNINDLESLRLSGAIDFYDLKEMGQTIVLYWRGIIADQPRRFSLALTNPNMAAFDCVERTHSIYAYYDKAGSIQYLNARNQLLHSGQYITQSQRRRLRLRAPEKVVNVEPFPAVKTKRNLMRAAVRAN